jgi:hypothetical protein
MLAPLGLELTKIAASTGSSGKTILSSLQDKSTENTKTINMKFENFIDESATETI